MKEPQRKDYKTDQQYKEALQKYNEIIINKLILDT